MTPEQAAHVVEMVDKIFWLLSGLAFVTAFALIMWGNHIEKQGKDRQ